MASEPDDSLDELRDQVIPWERNFREQMARMREERGLTQTDLARKLSAWGLPFHQQTIQRVEAGQRPVRLNEALLIARELGVSLDSMMATSTPSARTMMYAVGEMRKESERFASDIVESLSDWSESVAGLSLAVGELLGQYDGSGHDPVLKYGFKWANLAYDAYAHISEGLQRLVEIDEGCEVPPRWTFDELDHMSTWWDHYDELLSGVDSYPKSPNPDGAQDGPAT